MHRKDKTPPEASSMRASLKLYWQYDEWDEGRSERPDDVLGKDTIYGGKRLVGNCISLPYTSRNEKSEQQQLALVARVERSREMGVDFAESGYRTEREPQLRWKKKNTSKLTVLSTSHILMPM